MKVLLSTMSYPPVIGGSSFLLHELLKHWEKDSLFVIHGINDPPVYGTHDLPFWRKQIKVFNSNLWTIRFLRRLPSLSAILIKRELLKVVKKRSITHIYAHYPSSSFVIAAYLVAKKMKLPLTIYYDIIWDKGDDTPDSKLAKKYEKRILNYAQNRFAITEFAVTYLKKKHNLNFELIPHTANILSLKKSKIIKENVSVPKFHFAGGIYENMNKDALLRIYNVICEIFLEFELELCTTEIPVELIKDNRVKQRYYNKEELIISQNNSDVLILPQAFDSGKLEMIKNNFPTKTMEYVCSGTPILVHSPKDSYLAYITRKYKFGVLVDDKSTEQLKNGILRLINDNQYRQELIKNAEGFAKSRNSQIWSMYLKERICK
jgi:glycosyltransferase involved in cell wall biosynthesis